MAYSKHFPKVFTEDEITLIVEHILQCKSYSQTQGGDFLRWRDLTAIELMYYAGLRPAECLQLRWDDLDFEKELIYVRPYINHHRKNDLPAVMTKPAKKILERYKEKLNEMNINNAFLFPSFWTWKPITTSAMNKKFLVLCREIGLVKVEYYTARGQPKYSVNLYCLRHSFATRIYKRTGSEIAVSRLCRHTQVQSASIYTHLNFDDKKQIAAAVFS